MLREVLDAFVAKDAERARKVIDRDQVVDALYAQVFRELLTFMMESAHNVYRATRLQSIAKYLERMADHTTNLAEMVIFMVDGQDVRHLTSREDHSEQDQRWVEHRPSITCRAMPPPAKTVHATATMWQ
jgi:phosphate transport system protein